jgi:hypothetical protein
MSDTASLITSEGFICQDGGACPRHGVHADGGAGARPPLLDPNLIGLQLLFLESGNPYSAFSGDRREMPKIEGEHQAAMAFSAGGHRSVGVAEWKITVARHQLAHTWKIVLSAVEDERPFLEVAEKGIKHRATEPRVDHVGHLGHDSGRYEIGTSVRPQRANGF